MKQKLLLKTLLLLFALIAGSSSVWAVDVTSSLTLSGGTFSDGKITWILKDGSDNAITVQQLKGNSSTNVNSSYISAPRLYKGHVLSFTGATGYYIKSISITYDGTYCGNSMTAGTAISENVVTDNTTAVNRTWASTSGGTHVVSSASSDGLSQIYIQNVASSTNTQLRPTAISITYNKVAVTKHTATFSVDGVTSSTDFAEGEDIVFPVVSNKLGKKFMGWTTSAIVGTQVSAPDPLLTEATMSTSDITYYAVFAYKDAGKFVLDYSAESALSESTAWGSYGTAYTYTASDGGEWTVKAYKSSGMQINMSKNCSIKIPTCPSQIKSIDITCSAAKAVGLSASDYSGSGTITYIVLGTDATSQTLDLSSKSVKTGYIVPKGGSTSITKIEVKYSDDAIIKDYCTSVPTTVSITPAKTYTTLTSAYPLDFTSVSGDLKAYIATSVSADNVQMTQVNKVPANTGLVLKATSTGSPIAVPILSDVANDVSANKMEGAANATTAIAENGGYILKDGVFQPATAGTLAAGKAYLAIAVSSASELLLDFDGDVTGINSIENGTLKIENAEVYNLAGQRVAQPTKGLYIVNGRKVVIK